MEGKDLRNLMGCPKVWWEGGGCRWPHRPYPDHRATWPTSDGRAGTCQWGCWNCCIAVAPELECEHHLSPPPLPPSPLLVTNSNWSPWIWWQARGCGQTMGEGSGGDVCPWVLESCLWSSFDNRTEKPGVWCIVKGVGSVWPQHHIPLDLSFGMGSAAVFSSHDLPISLGNRGVQT